MAGKSQRFARAKKAISDTIRQLGTDANKARADSRTLLGRWSLRCQRLAHFVAEVVHYTCVHAWV
eukprot:6227806-Pyramimonas_sp.AAC.1